MADKKAKKEQKEETKQKSEMMLKVNNWGLINCDKFINEEIVPLELAADISLYAKYYLVFDEIRGVLNGREKLKGFDIFSEREL